MSALVSLLTTAGGLVLLIVGAELLIRGASSLAKRLAIAEIVIGLTVVAFGTSTPEMVVNVFASSEGRNEIVFGNIIGSNIFNILFILGISGLIYPVVVQRNTVWKEIPFSLLATLVLFFLVNDRLDATGTADILSRADGIVLLLLFTIFVVYTFGLATVEASDEFDVRVYSWGISAALIVGGLLLLVAGGRLCVEGAVALARQLNLSEKFIGATVVAAGTSLPELATSAIAAYRKHSDIAVGNVVGSNIFNILAILGVSAVIRPAPYPASFNADLYVLTAATLLLLLVMFTGKRHKLDRWEASLMLAGYAGYVGYLLYLR
ncbi:MAG TPA: calcium/sodium antiporter [Sedimentisphaerales bacterium]|nr:calcium/sodium antiporter [Sedimentisphaerales bacterium]